MPHHGTRVEKSKLGPWCQEETADVHYRDEELLTKHLTKNTDKHTHKDKLLFIL